jgi:predicted RND superfamily exporter protein
VVKTDNAFDPLTFGKIEALSASFSGIEGVRRVISLPEIKKAVDISAKKWNLSEFAAMLAPVKLFKGNLISRDRKVASLTLVLTSEADRESVIRAVDRIISNPSLSFTAYQIGIPLISQALARYTAKDFLRLPPITLVLIALLLFALYRRISYLVLPFACIVVVLTWTFGFMALIGIPLSIATSLIASVAISLAVDDTIHCLHRYNREFKKDLDKDRARHDTIMSVGRPIVFRTITISIGFFILLLSSFKPTAIFGMLMVLTMLAALVGDLIILPSLMLHVELITALN